MGLLYTNMKIFHFKDKIDGLPASEKEIKSPVQIRIKPTNVCNHNCWYCSYKKEGIQLGQDMVEKDHIPEEKMMEIVDDIIEMDVKAVTFSGGGEPFCYPHLLKTAKRLSQTPVKFASLTNGARMKGEVAEVFAHHAKWVRVSMDGWDGPSYAKYRGVKESEFDKVVQNMKDFKSYGGDCLLGVSYIVDKDNQSRVYDMLQKLRDIRVDSIKVSPCIVSNDGRETNEYHKPFFGSVKEQLQKFQKDNPQDKLQIFDAYHDVEEKFVKDYTWCPYLQSLTVIGADLNVYSCQDKAYNLDEGLLGSIKNQRFKDFWFSDKKNFFKINPSKVCNHHCVSNIKNELVLDYLNADQEHLEFI
ncbi:MAG: radical SAM protein [Candidatus Omnitrophica bacterium]|nr:radical SAM protein [Candidatus Omnitrophota bacterium]